MSLRIADIVAFIEELAPARLAEPWDRVGLLAGDPQRELSGVLLTLDATIASVEEARQAGCGLVLSHHPPSLEPPATLTPDTLVGSQLLRLAESGIALLVAHTNLDACEKLGTSRVLAQVLGLEGDSRPIRAASPARAFKLVTFVPEEDADRVAAALAEAGAGHMGAYTHCSFRMGGIGAFLPEGGAQPHVGQVGELARVPEVRLEMRVEGGALRPAVDALLRTHPYEEVAYDVYALEGPTPSAGLGLVIDLPEPVGGRELAERVIERLAAPGTRIIGSPDRPIRRVAVCAGSGGSLLRDVLAAGAEAYITGDIRHHDALYAAEAGLLVIDAGHFATERPVLAELASALNNEFGSELRVQVATGLHDPIRPAGMGEG